MKDKAPNQPHPAIDPFDDDLDDVVIAADDTGMLAGERLITQAELTEADPAAGNV